MTTWVESGFSARLLATSAAVATLTAAILIACQPAETTTESPPPTEIQNADNQRDDSTQRVVATLRAQISATPLDVNTPTHPQETAKPKVAQAQVQTTPRLPDQLELLPTATAGTTPVGEPPTIVPTETPTAIAIPASETEPTRSEVVALIYRWLGEHPTRARRETADQLVLLNTYHPTLASRLLKMPFMTTHEPHDTGTIAALANMSINRRDRADDIAAHPSLAEGITDAQTHAIALTYAESIYGVDITRSLAEGAFHTKSKTTEMPLSGTVEITIAERNDITSQHLIDDIHQSLIWLENYLQYPLPTANVLVHYDAKLPSGAKGANLQVSISHTPDQASPANFHWTQHELIHYWFNSNQVWLDEGIAQTLTSLMQAPADTGTPTPRSPNCTTGEKIADTIGTTTTGELASWCTYGLGERFMLTLYDQAGPEQFRKGLAALAMTAQSRAYPPLRLQDFREAFDHVPEAVETAVTMWYESIK